MIDKELGFRFLRNTEDTLYFRKYNKVEDFQTGGIIFTGLAGFKTLADSLSSSGYEAINYIIKGDYLYKKVQDTLTQYKEICTDGNDKLIKDVNMVGQNLLVKTVKLIERYQDICLMYNEIRNRPENFDTEGEEEEKEAIYEKVDEIIFGRFLEEDWTPSEDEDYNDTAIKLNVEYEYGNFYEYHTNYISEFMSELNQYLARMKQLTWREGTNIIKLETVVDDYDTLVDFEVDFPYAMSYVEMKKAILMAKSNQNVLADNLIKENAPQLLKNERVALNMTLQEVSELTGLTPGFISRIENKSSSLSLESLYKLCLVYNKDINTFLTNNSSIPLNKLETCYLDEMLLNNKMKVNDVTLTHSDKECILNLLNLLTQTKTNKDKETIKRIINELAKLELEK